MEKVNKKAEIKLIQVCYLAKNPEATLPVLLNGRPNLDLYRFANTLDLYQYLKSGHQPDLLLLDIESQGFDFIHLLQQDPFLKKTPIVLIAPEINKELMERAQKLGVDDIFAATNLDQHFLSRLNYLVKKYCLLNKRPTAQSLKEVIYADIYRGLNVVLAAVSLLIYSPLLALVAVLIKLSSKGPVFENAKRMGAGGKIFDFYRFRTTAEVKLVSENFPRLQLVSSNVKTRILGMKGSPNSPALSFQEKKDNQPVLKSPDNKFTSESTDVSLRITKMGALLRQTGLLELPGLINMVQGNLYLLPNRPQPLYQATLLTPEEYKLRFASQTNPVTLSEAVQKSMDEALVENQLKEEMAIIPKTNIWLHLQAIPNSLPGIPKKSIFPTPVN